MGRCLAHLMEAGVARAEEQGTLESPGLSDWIWGLRQGALEGASGHHMP